MIAGVPDLSRDFVGSDLVKIIFYKAGSYSERTGIFHILPPKAPCSGRWRFKRIKEMVNRKKNRTVTQQNFGQGLRSSDKWLRDKIMIKAEAEKKKSVETAIGQ